MKVFETHVMLFRLVTRVDGDPGGHAHFAAQQTLYKCLAERSGAAGNQYSFSFQFFHFLKASYGVASAAILSTISCQSGGRNPVASRYRDESRLRSMAKSSKRSI